MRMIEAARTDANSRLQPADPRDPRSFKTRQGKVGSYGDVLDGTLLDHMNKVIDSNLDPIFGYAGNHATAATGGHRS